jgi:hypothetical protein
VNDDQRNHSSLTLSVPWLNKMMTLILTAVQSYVKKVEYLVYLGACDIFSCQLLILLDGPGQA